MERGLEMRYNTNQVADAIQKREAFTTNGAVYGVIISGKLAVYSYAEPIALFDFERSRVHLNERRYSNTTGRHQSQARRAALSLEADGFDVDKWDDRQFEEVTGLSTRNRNPFYSFY